MPRVKVNHYYCGRKPGEVVEVSDKEAKRLVDTRGGDLVKQHASAQKATDTRSESAETREGMTTEKAKTVRKTEK